MRKLGYTQVEGKLFDGLRHEILNELDRSPIFVSRVTQDTDRNEQLTSTGLSPSLATLSRVFLFVVFFHGSVLQPQACRNMAGLG